MRHPWALAGAAALALAAGAARADIAPDPEDVDRRLMALARSSGFSCPGVRRVERYDGAGAEALRNQRLEPRTVTCTNGVQLMIADRGRFNRFDRRPIGQPVVRRLDGGPAPAPVKPR